MWSSASNIAAGDTVIVWMTRDSIQPLIVTPGKDFNSKYGNYRQADFVGVPYGSKIGSRAGQGFLYLLRPTPELWTLALPHRTQILYLADIAFITSRLDIKPGARVIEAGTGSGSFTHSVARTIGDSGHLWSYEFHEARANKARDEFLRHGMTPTVTLTHRNVCRDGFTVDDTVDAVFLDLPAPWDAIQHAKKTLRKDRVTRICCFSPCMEQVLRTVAALNDAGFTEITMYETLLRPHEIAQVPQLQSIGHISEKLKEAEKRREEKRLRQIANNKARQAVSTAATAASTATTPPLSASPAPISSTVTKRKREDGDHQSTQLDLAPDSTSPEPKRVKADDADGETEVEANNPITSGQMNVIKAEDLTDDDDGEMAVDEYPIQVSGGGGGGGGNASHHQPVLAKLPPRISVSNALPDVRGHTSYLTFAVLVPPLSTTTTTLHVVDPKLLDSSSLPSSSGMGMGMADADAGVPTLDSAQAQTQG